LDGDFDLNVKYEIESFIFHWEKRVERNCCRRQVFW
jgi:hypothetical protein